VKFSSDSILVFEERSIKAVFDLVNKNVGKSNQPLCFSVSLSLKAKPTTQPAKTE